MTSKWPPNASHLGCFWHHIYQKVVSRRVPENVSKTESKKYQKRSQKGWGFQGEKSPKSHKSEPWAQNVPQASRRGSQGPKIPKNHEKWLAATTFFMKNGSLCQARISSSSNSLLQMRHGGGLCAQRTWIESCARSHLDLFRLVHMDLDFFLLDGLD